MHRSISALAVLFFSPLAFAADPRGDSPDAPPSTAQEQLAKFHVPPGFEVQLVADETQIQKPMNLNFDAAGRLWVSGSELYPWPAKVDALGQPIAGFDKVWAGTAGSFDAKNAPPPPERAIDTVRILSDFAPDGRARKVEVFADGLNIPIGLQPLPRKPGARGDSAIIFSIPNIWLMEDIDGDGRADKKEPLYTGFDFRDTHGMSSNYLYWIDGWIYGCHGFRNRSEVRDRAGRVTVFDSGNTYRFRPDGSQIEIYTHGQTNPFGLTVDPLGNFYSADSHSKPVMLLLRGGFYEGIGKQHDGLGFAPTITDDDHGSSAIAGIAYYADDKFPAEFRGNLFNGNPVTRRINRDRLEWHGSTPKAIRMPDFLTCDDPWFRPIQVKLGPDGALWIADFYNPIIGHYEFPLADPRRDHTRGRIWRVVWRGENASAQRAAAATPGSALVPNAGEGVPPSRTSNDDLPPATPAAPIEIRRGKTPQPARETRALPGVSLPDLTQLDVAGLVEKLADPNLTVRTLATHELVERVGKPACELLEERLTPSNEAEFFRALAESTKTGLFDTKADWHASSICRAHALWALFRIAPIAPRISTANAMDLSNLPSARIHMFAIISEHPRAKDALSSQRVALEVMAENSNPEPSSELHYNSTNSRILTDFMSRFPDVGNLKTLLTVCARSTNQDSALFYTARMALRASLLSSHGFDEATIFTVGDDLAAERIADVSLGAKTPEAAEFLLTYLERTKLINARNGDFLRHVALHVPAEKLGAIAGLVENVKDAPLPQRLSVAGNLGDAYRQRGVPLPDDIADWTQRALLEALSSEDDALLRRAVEAVREVTLEAKLKPLEKIARNTNRDGKLRIAALEAAVNLPASRGLLTDTLNNQTFIGLRKRAAELLAQSGHVDAVLAALPRAPHELALAISGALAKTDAGGAALLGVIEAGKASPQLLLNKAVAGPLNSRPKALQDRAAVLTKDLPPEDTRLNAVIAERATDYAKTKTDVAHGAQVFRQSCAVCHRFRNEGGNVGPNLDGVAARGAARLLEDILDPSRNVDPLFRQTTIETTDGQSFVGANLREEGANMLISDVTGKNLTISNANIAKQIPSALSLMPPVFETALTAADLNDLLGFLLK